VFCKVKKHKMKITNKQIKRMIKEELDDLNETMSSPAHDKLVELIIAGEEGLKQALELFDQIKGTGMMQSFEEDHIQRLSEYAGVQYRYKSVVNEMAALRKEFGVGARNRENWRKLARERAAALRAMRELEHNINPKDKRMIAQVTDFA